MNKIKLGDEFKWKEIKNGKPVTTRSTDQIRKKKNYYRSEKSYQSYEKSEEETNEPNNKRKAKGSYHKYYVNKKPKRPFQKCYEVPSDYHAPNKTQDQKVILVETYLYLKLIHQKTQILTLMIKIKMSKKKKLKN